jgi:lipid A ethanolaminephosphotransferase
MHLALGPVTTGNAGSYVCVFLLLLALLSLLIGLISYRPVQKPLAVVLLIVAAGASYFMDNYGAVIDRHAIQSALESDARESGEWLSWAMLWPMLWIGILPSLAIIFLVDIKPRSWSQAIKARLLMFVLCVVVAGGAIALNYQTFASVARNHAVLRDLFNPANVFNAIRTHYKKHNRQLPTVIAPIAADIQRGPSWAKIAKPTLFVIVIGESARSASFSLAGYQRATNPELGKRDITFYPRVMSCGTNTATSVPCMFSSLGRKNYDENKALSQDNLLDVVKRAGFAVEWIDNNTGSKNVARRMIETDVAHETTAPLCSAAGCHDEILLRELDKRIASINTDSVLVLHQLGSHGPAYFERYPPAFRKFLPECTAVELHACDAGAVKNAYDNTILYTDFVLASMIDRLAAASNKLSVGMVFVSDHGESTGESGFFLHGAPYAFAPAEQITVPMLTWMAPDFLSARGFDRACLESNRNAESNHDAFFPLVLAMLDLRTAALMPAPDPVSTCRENIAQ